jgi:hypothetical protein
MPVPRKAAAEFYLFRAQENLNEGRQKLHKEGGVGFEDPFLAACDMYTQAYYKDFRSFDLNQIENAIDACMSGKSFEAAGSFMRMKDRYLADQRHQAEAKKAPQWVRKASYEFRKTESLVPAMGRGTKPTVTPRTSAAGLDRSS